LKTESLDNSKKLSQHPPNDDRLNSNLKVATQDTEESKELTVFKELIKKFVQLNRHKSEYTPYLAISAIFVIDIMEKHGVNDIFLSEDKFFLQKYVA
jgi:hypothetical protein